MALKLESYIHTLEIVAKRNTSYTAKSQVRFSLALAVALLLLFQTSAAVSQNRLLQ